MKRPLDGCRPSEPVAKRPFGGIQGSEGSPSNAASQPPTLQPTTPLVVPPAVSLATLAAPRPTLKKRVREVDYLPLDSGEVELALKCARYASEGAALGSHESMMNEGGSSSSTSSSDEMQLIVHPTAAFPNPVDGDLLHVSGLRDHDLLLRLLLLRRRSPFLAEPSMPPLLQLSPASAHSILKSLYDTLEHSKTEGEAVMSVDGMAAPEQQQHSEDDPDTQANLMMVD